MPDTPNTGETVTAGDSQTPVQTPATPVVNASDPAEVERLRKEREQIEMERNQLRNELEARKKADADAKAKQLEEEGRYKEIAQNAQAELDRIKEEQARQERAKELQSATDNVFKDFPGNVIEIAKTTGLSLNDDSDEAITALKEKLETIKKSVAPSATPSANNPHTPTPANADKAELYGRMRGDNVEVSRAATREFIRNHPAVQRMKEIAQNGA